MREHMSRAAYNINKYMTEFIISRSLTLSLSFALCAVFYCFIRNTIRVTRIFANYKYFQQQQQQQKSFKLNLFIVRIHRRLHISRSSRLPVCGAQAHIQYGLYFRLQICWHNSQSVRAFLMFFFSFFILFAYMRELAAGHKIDIIIIDMCHSAYLFLEISKIANLFGFVIFFFFWLIAKR